ncbi:MAG: ATP-binding cassette domain-containing protein, partial [Acidimicrobiales bacterium]
MTNVSVPAIEYASRTSVALMADSCIDLHNVSVRFAGRDVLQGITWQVQPCERWVILGRNGCGKTTLLRTVSMYHHPTTGSVRILGELWGQTYVRELRRHIGLVSSSLADLIRPDLRAFDVVLTARHGALEPWWHSYSDQDRARAQAEMERMQVAHLGEHSFISLSSGERQR